VLCPAADALSGSDDATDQRGVARPQGGACDAGAFEFAPVDTTTTLSVTPGAAATFGQSVTLTATVASVDAGLYSGVPQGTIVFSEGSTPFPPIPLDDSGRATLTLPSLAGGSHNFSAAYTPADNNVLAASQTSPTTYQVAPAATTTKLSVTPTPSQPVVAGIPILLTATVAPTSGDGQLTGTVTFRDGATRLGTATLWHGVATLRTSALAVGTHSLTATYSGDADYAASSSAAVHVQIQAQYSQFTPSGLVLGPPPTVPPSVQPTPSPTPSSGTPPPSVTTPVAAEVGGPGPGPVIFALICFLLLGGAMVIFIVRQRQPIGAS
jgi:hypothetical protein